MASRASTTFPTRAIIDANGLRPPYALRVGQRLTLPTVRTHVVQAGDTVNNLARRYNVEMSSLVRSNAIDPPYRIMAGQTLILPGSAAPPDVQVARAADPSPALGAVPPAVPADAGRVCAANERRRDEPGAVGRAGGKRSRPPAATCADAP